MDRLGYALRALFWTLRRSLPARLAAADAARRAELVLAPGPYTIPAAGEVKLRGVTKALTAGVRTAAQLVVDLGAGGGIPGLTATADAEGGLVLQGPLAPTAAAPSSLRVDGASANAALGLQHGQSDALVLSLADPRFTLLERQLFGTASFEGPVVAMDRELRDTPQVPLRIDGAVLQVPLAITFPGPVGQAAATLEAVGAFAAELAAVIRTGDGRGAYMIGGETYGEAIEKADLVGALTTAVAARGPKGQAVTFGVALIPIEIRLYDA